MIAEQTIPVSGGASHWTLQPVDRQKFEDLLGRLGYDNLMPPERRNGTVLRECMEELKAKGQIVQALKNASDNGYETVTVDRGQTANLYLQDYRAAVDEFGGITSASCPHLAQLQSLFYERKSIVTGSTAGQVLVDIAKKLQAVMLWPGTYWIPEHSLDAWKSVMEGMVAIQKDNKVQLIYVEKMSLDTVETVRDALVNEFSSSVHKMRAELEADDKEFGEEALDNRRITLALMRNKLMRYGEIVGEWNDWLDHILTEADEAVATAALKSMQGI